MMNQHGWCSSLLGFNEVYRIHVEANRLGIYIFIDIYHAGLGLSIIIPISNFGILIHYCFRRITDGILFSIFSCKVVLIKWYCSKDDSWIWLSSRELTYPIKKSLLSFEDDFSFSHQVGYVMLVPWRVSSSLNFRTSQVISTGDDAIAIKSGLNKAGTTFGMPSAADAKSLGDLNLKRCLFLHDGGPEGQAGKRLENGVVYLFVVRLTWWTRGDWVAFVDELSQAGQNLLLWCEWGVAFRSWEHDLLGPHCAW